MLEENQGVMSVPGTTTEVPESDWFEQAIKQATIASAESLIDPPLHRV